MSAGVTCITGLHGISPTQLGWEWSTLSECCEVILGQSPPGDTYNENGIGLPFFQGKSEFGSLYPSPRKWCSAPTKIAERDDVLISVRAPVGPTNLSPSNCCIGRGLAAVRPLGGMESRFVLNWLRASADSLASLATGSTFSAISGETLRAHPIPLPPLAEQRRIVAEIETQFTRLDAAVAALERARAKLRRYRAAVLEAVFTGPLVSVSSVLRSPLANGRSVPDGSGGFPVLRLTALQNGWLDLEQFKEGAWTEDLARPFVVSEGDFFVARGNGSLALVGRGGLARSPKIPVAFPDTMIRVRCDHQKVLPQYLRLVWDAPSMRKQIESTARTTAGIHKINQQDIEGFLIPAPSVEDQLQLVDEAERCIAVTAKIQMALVFSHA